MHDLEFAYALVRHNVCSHFDAMRLTCAAQRERGGILIGSFRGPHIDVLGYTEPGSRDQASQSSFKRLDECHQHVATDAYRRSNGTATYVGEWHSHPFGTPTPSSIDRDTWKMVLARLRTPCLFVVVSPLAWQAFRIRRGQRRADMTPLRQIEIGSTGIVFR